MSSNENFNNSEFDECCDLDPTKICDNCERCIGLNEDDYMEIMIDGIIKENVESYEEYEDFEIFNEVEESESKENQAFEYDFIEDYEELRDKYYKDIEDILKGEKDT